MRDNMLINTSGLDNQWMGVDMNIEHLINFLKVTIFPTRDQCTYLFTVRQYSPQRGSTHLGIASVIFQPLATSCVLPRSTLDGS